MDLDGATGPRPGPGGPAAGAGPGGRGVGLGADVLVDRLGRHANGPAAAPARRPVFRPVARGLHHFPVVHPLDSGRSRVHSRVSTSAYLSAFTPRTPPPRPGATSMTSAAYAPPPIPPVIYRRGWARI